MESLIRKLGRIAVSCWSNTRLFRRTITPAILMAASMIASYHIGRAGASEWLVLISMLFGGAAIGTAYDRAEAVAASEWARRFWRLIETDHVLEVTVTHKAGDAQ